MKRMPSVDVVDGESADDALSRLKLAGQTGAQIVESAKEVAKRNAESMKKRLGDIATPNVVHNAPPSDALKTDGPPQFMQDFNAAMAADAPEQEEPAADAQTSAPAEDLPPMPSSGMVINVPIDQIVRAANVRKVLGDLTEIVASMKKVGVLQAVLVRPKDDRYELVTGYRRVAAAEEAGLTSIPVDVRPYTDAQVVEVQLVENIQRKNLDPLDEADGFAKLKNEFGQSTATIAASVGKSVRWVQTHMQLTKLCGEGRKALGDGRLVLEIAMRIANIPSHKLQAEAVEKVTAPVGLDKERMSARAAKDYLSENFTTELRGAPFNQKDDTLVPEAGSCVKCPKRSGANPNLFGDAFVRADICTDILCFKAKKQAAWEAEQAKAKLHGFKTVSLNEGAKIFKNGTPSHDSAWVDLGAVCPEDPKKRSWKEVLGEEVLEKPKDGDTLVTIAPDTAGKPHQLLKKDDALRIAKDRGLKWATRATELEDARKPATKEEAAKRELDSKVQSAVETEVLAKAVKWVETNGISPAVLRMMGFGLAAAHHPDVLERREMKTDRDLIGFIEKTTSEKVLLGVVFELAVTEWIRGFEGYGDEIKTMAKVMKIDIGEIEKRQTALADANAIFEGKKK